MRKARDLDMDKVREIASASATSQEQQVPAPTPPQPQTPPQAPAQAHEVKGPIGLLDEFPVVYENIKNQRTVRFPEGLWDAAAEFLDAYGVKGDSVNKLMMIGFMKELNRRKELVKARQLLDTEG